MASSITPWAKAPTEAPIAASPRADSPISRLGLYIPLARRSWATLAMPSCRPSIPAVSTIRLALLNSPGAIMSASDFLTPRRTAWIGPVKRSMGASSVRPIAVPPSWAANSWPGVTSMPSDLACSTRLLASSAPSPVAIPPRVAALPRPFAMRVPGTKKDPNPPTAPANSEMVPYFGASDS